MRRLRMAAGELGGAHPGIVDAVGALQNGGCSCTGPPSELSAPAGSAKGRRRRWRPAYKKWTWALFSKSRVAADEGWWWGRWDVAGSIIKPNGVFEEPGPKEPVSLVPSVILVPKPRKTKRRIRLGTDIGSFGWFLRSEPMYIWPDSIRLLTEGTSEGTAHYFPIWFRI